jgi:predicted lipoprotein with Yx(FWY)xxD motif
MMKQAYLKLGILALCLSVSALAGEAQSALPDGVTTRSTTAGNVLTDARGMTLYTLDKDRADKSVCNDQCAVLWPPLLAKEGATAPANWMVITRADGSKQWSYKGKPLYTFAKDLKPGDVTGNGYFGGIWHVVKT